MPCKNHVLLLYHQQSCLIKKKKKRQCFQKKKKINNCLTLLDLQDTYLVTSSKRTQRRTAPSTFIYENSSLNKRNDNILPPKYSFSTCFLPLSIKQNPPLEKTPIAISVIFINYHIKLPFSNLHQGSRSIWWIIPRTSKTRNKEKILLPGTALTMDRLFLLICAQGQ